MILSVIEKKKSDHKVFRVCRPWWWFCERTNSKLTSWMSCIWSTSFMKYWLEWEHSINPSFLVCWKDQISWCWQKKNSLNITRKKTISLNFKDSETLYRLIKRDYWKGTCYRSDWVHEIYVPYRRRISSPWDTYICGT